MQDQSSVAELAYINPTYTPNKQAELSAEFSMRQRHSSPNLSNHKVDCEMSGELAHPRSLFALQSLDRTMMHENGWLSSLSTTMREKRI